MDTPELRNLFIALLIGALVDIERDKRKVAEQDISFGGMRTFILFAQAGAVSAWLSSISATRGCSSPRWRRSPLSS
jgi:uncharacterized membrane protein YhiD involved in acid resistance